MSENNAFQGNNSLTNTTTQRPLYSTIPVINLENYQQKTFQQYELSSAFLNNLLKKQYLLHKSQLKALSPAWTITCVRKLLTEKRTFHINHARNPSRKYELPCFRTLPLWENDLSHKTNSELSSQCELSFIYGDGFFEEMTYHTKHTWQLTRKYELPYVQGDCLSSKMIYHTNHTRKLSHQYELVYA